MSQTIRTKKHTDGEFTEIKFGGELRKDMQNILGNIKSVIDSLINLSWKVKRHSVTAKSTRASFWKKKDNGKEDQKFCDRMPNFWQKMKI